MVDKISVEIGLEGGQEVASQLEDIGKSGQKAFGDIQSAADQVNLDNVSSGFNDLGNAGQAAFQKVQSAAQNAASFEQVVTGVKQVEGAFGALGTAVGKMATRMTRSLGVIGVAARALGPLGIALGVAGGAFLKFGDSAADGLNALTGAAAKLGQTPQQLDALQKAFTRAGVAPDTLAVGLEKFKQSLGEDFFPRSLTDGLQSFIGELERMPDSVQRTQAAMERLGEGLGAAVIAGLQTGTITAQNFAAALGQVRPVTQQQIVDAAKYQQALNQLSAAWTELKAAFAPILTPVFGLLTQEIKNLMIDIKGLIIDIKNLWTFLQALAGVFTAQGPDEMRAALLKVAEAYKQLGTGAQQAAEQARQGTGVATGDVAALGQTAAQTSQQLAGLGQAGAAAGAQTANSMGNATQSMGNFLIATQRGIVLLQGVTEAAARAAQFIANLSRPTSIPSLESQRPRPIGPGMAGGGLLGGRGTGTSDSNLAWVSRGEHIMPARAVAQPGVLAFLEALRRSGGNLSRVLDGMGRFALGGLVPRPAFAAGGAVGSMSNVTINFPGSPPISGLRASADVVDQLQKAAALAQVRSGGRKPSRYS